MIRRRDAVRWCVSVYTVALIVAAAIWLLLGAMAAAAVPA